MTATGVKHDNGKPRWSLLPAGVIASVVRVLEHGARKYEHDNWQHIDNPRYRYYDAAMRHIDAWWSGVELDDETGEPHMAHAICCLMFLLWFQLNSKVEP